VRISVIGPSGSGKSTTAALLAQTLGLARIELDEINWQAGWRDLNTHDRPEFIRRVAEAAAGAAWVCDGNYSTVRAALWPRLTHLVWLDFDPIVFMPRVLRRSFMRSLTKRPLWNGNRESWGSWLDPEHPARFAWDSWRSRRAGYETLLAKPEWAHLTVFRLRRPREADAMVAALRAARVRSAIS
jgi:adenylate kinase family enzyme